ncbi:MAG TPA: outer membrane protein transport protein, partial [Thermoanaerobaculia bacterium]|nr:outer membrane protein transport protein [Thermoanaerobaculia bacterium]
MCSLLGLSAAPAWASGFSAFDSGVKAMGFSGAFTAQADDPTAVFYNLGGLALLEKGKLTGGSTGVYLNESQFRGTSPGIARGTAGEQEQSLSPQPHAYAVKAFGQSKKLKWGTGIYMPYAFETEWTDPESFSGRLLTTDAQLQTYDVTTSLAYPITKNFGFGAGVIYRSSTFDLG